jgi:hypothetical protein
MGKEARNEEGDEMMKSNIRPERPSKKRIPSTDEKKKMIVTVMIETPKGSRNKYQRPSFEEQSSLKKILAGKSGLNNLQYVCSRGLRRQLPHE